MFIAEKSCPEVNVTPSRSSRHQSIVAFHLKCARCALGDATKNMLDAARIGRQTANGPAAQEKRATKPRKNAFAQHSWDPSHQPAWLTSEPFTHKIQPLLASVAMSTIQSAIGVSKWYASKIRQGWRPHQRHWQALAQLVGVSG